MNARFHTIRAPRPSDIAAAVARLGKRGFSEIFLDRGEGSERTSLALGGGQADRLVVSVARSDDAAWDPTFVHIVDRHAADGTLCLVVGGQASDLPARLCVSRTHGLRAAQHFAARAELDPSLPWEPIEF